MKAKTAIQKGKELENWIVERLRLSGLDTRAYRQKGSGSGLNKGDIWNNLNLCIEAKNQKNIQKKWFKQAEKESLGTQEPILVWHPSQEPLENSKVFLNWDYFEKLLKQTKEPEMKNIDRTVAWKIRTAINALKSLLKELE